MDDQNKNANELSVGELGGQNPLSSSIGVVPAPAEYNPDSLSFDPTALAEPPKPVEQVVKPKGPNVLKAAVKRIAKHVNVILLVLLVLSLVGLFIGTSTKKSPVGSTVANDPASNYDTQQVTLEDFAIPEEQSGLQVVSNIAINGSLNLNGGLVVAPSAQPKTPSTGQLYYAEDTNNLAYYNGTEFVALGGGVTSVQGETGAVTLTAGAGIAINGTTITNTRDATLQGTVGRIAKFTGSGSASDSLLSELGTTVTVEGSLSLANALAVGSGGTGAASLTANGVVIGQGNDALVAIAAGSAGLCLVSTSGAPAFSACPGTGGVASLNGLSGDLTVANATSSGSTITIDDASTTTKGIASFNATNFTATSGAINTIQDIGNGASPTFANLTLQGGLITVGTAAQAGGLVLSDGSSNTGTIQTAALGQNTVYTLPDPGGGAASVCLTTGNCAGAGSGVTTTGGTTGTIPIFTGSQTLGNSIITQSGIIATVNGDLAVVTGGLSLSNALTVSNGGTGAISLAANGVIVGNGTAALTSVTAGGTGLCLLSTAGAPAFSACPSSSGVSSLNGLTGALNVANASGAGSTVTIDDASTVAKGIASFNATNFSVSSGAVTTIQNINTGASPTFAAVNTSTITPGGAMTLGATTQTALLQGLVTTITSTGAGNDIVLNSADTIELQDNTNITGALNVSGNAVLQGGSLTVGVASSQTGSVAFKHSASAFTGTLVQGALGGDRTYTLPDASGTVCLTSGNCSGAASTLQDAYNSGNTIATTTARDLSVTLADTATDSNFTVTTATNATGFTTFARADGGGTADPAQLVLIDNLDTDRAQPTGVKVQSSAGGLTTAVDVSDPEIVTALSFGANDISGTNFSVTGSSGAILSAGSATLQGGSLTLGTNSQAGSVVFYDGSSNTGTLQTVALGQNTAYSLPDPGQASASICLSTGNCAGAGSGVTTSGGSVNRLAKFTAGQIVGDSTITDNGTSVTTSVDLVIQGGDVTVGAASSQVGTINFAHNGSANLGSITQGALTGNQTYTLPDASGTFCLTSGNCSGTGSTNTLQAAYDAGNTIATTSARNLSFTLADTATDSNFTITTATGSTGFTSIARADGAGTADPAQLVLIDNLDTDRVQPIGLKIQAAAGGLTTAIDATDAEIGDALSVGANNIVGTTGNIDLTNFDVVGSSGNVVTLGNINTTGGVIQTNSTTRLDNSGNLSNIGTLSLSGSISGGTTFSGSGNINTTGGALQTNSVTRIDNSGNLTNIGNLTATGAITIASSGAGNDIILNGADILDVQDAATFASTINVTGTTTLSGDFAANGTNLSLGDAASDLLTVTSTIQGASPLVFEGGSADASELAISIAALTGDQTITLPDATGTVCLTVGNCSGTGSTNTLQAAYDAGNSITTTTARDIDIVLANTATDSNLDIVVADDSTSYVSVTRANGSGTNNPTQLLLIDNLDTNQGIANGIIVQSAAGAITDGIDASDAELVNAINVGANVIIGSTADIDFTNFDVVGSSGNVTAGGNLNLSGGGQYQISGVQISSSALSNNSDLAKLASSQTFTGNANAFQNGSNSTNAFNVQNAAGARVLTIDTTNGEAELGVGSTLDGKLVFNNVSNTNTVTILPGTPSGNRTLTLPNASGIICTDSGNCLGAGSTLQTSYNFSVGGTTPKIKLNSTLNGVDIQDADTTIGADLFDVRESNGSGLGQVMFGVGNTGQITLQNGTNSTTAFRLLTDGGTTVLVGDTTNGQVLLGQGGTLAGTLVFSNATNSNKGTLQTAVLGQATTYTLPDPGGASASVCLSSGNCSGTGSTNTLQAAYDAGNSIATTNARDISITLADTATDGNLTISTATGGTGFTSILRADGAGTADPAQLLLIKNNDTNRAQPLGISVQSAAGGITTAFDASGSNLTNALAIGANAITGTNFSVTGAGAVTAVGVNAGAGLLQGALGLTISGATASVNNNSNFATNINTGTSNGTITLGGGSAPLVIDSTAFDVTSGGAVSGVTTLATSGIITAGSVGSADTATYLCRNAANHIATCNTTGSGVAFLQGGNTLGATATLGTNDSNALDIRTNGTTRMTFVAGGGITIPGNNSADELEIGDNIADVNDSSSRINLGSTAGNSVIRVGESTLLFGAVYWDVTNNIYNLSTGFSNVPMQLQVNGGSTTVGGALIQSYTGTTTDATAITANALTTATAFKVTSSNNSAANTAWSANQLNVTNAQGTTAVSTGSIYGFDLQFTQAPTVASNIESVANFAIKQNDSSTTDNTVSSIINVVNNDTSTGNQITATDGIKVTGSNITNGLNLSGTFGTNLITSSNFTVTQAGAGTFASNLVVQGTTGLTFNTGAGGDITFANGEKIDNDSNGTINLQADSGALGLLLTGTAATVSNSAGNLTLDSASGRVVLATGDFLNIGVAGVSGATSGDIWYDTSAQKFKVNENGSTKILCNTTDLGCGAGGNPRLDQITAANTNASISNGANNIVWNWQLTAAESGFTFGESAASTGGNGDQFILDVSTASGSTAAPLRVTSNSTDAGDIIFNLASAGDLKIQDNGTSFLTAQDNGLIAIGNVTATAQLHVLGAAGTGFNAGTDGLIVTGGAGSNGGDGISGGAGLIATGGAGGNGNSNGDSGGVGGVITLTTGAGGNGNALGGTGGAGGAISLTAANGGTGASFAGGAGGAITLTAGNGNTGSVGGAGGNISLIAGTNGGTGAVDGGIYLRSGAAKGIQIQDASSNTVLGINNLTTGLNLIANSSFEANVNGWTAKGSTTVTHDDTASNAQYGSRTLKAVTTASSSDGVQFAYPLKASQQYSFAVWVKASSGTPSVILGRQENGSNVETSCSGSATSTSWQQFSCTFTTGATINSTSNIYIRQTAASAATYFVDGATLATTSTVATFVQPGSEIQVDSNYSNITLNDTASGEVQPWNLNPTTLPANRQHAGVAVGNGYMYVAGGTADGSTYETTVYYAKLNADGTTGTWNTTTALSIGIGHMAATVANGYLYLVGGWDGSVGFNTIYYAKINSDGTVGAWRANFFSIGHTLSSATLILRIAPSVATRNGYMYIAGGCSDNSAATCATPVTTIYYGKMNADGTIGPWSTATQALPAARGMGAATIANGYFYYTHGGNNTTVQSTTYYAPIAASGDITTAFATTGASGSLTARRELSSVAMNGYWYLLGGCTSMSSGLCNATTTTVTYAKFMADGTLGAWTQAGNVLPAARGGLGAAGFNGHIYSIGGFSSATRFANVWRASTARTTISGTLDLVASSAQGLTDFGGGGSITAGTGYFLGDLKVDGMVDLGNGLSVYKALNVNAAGSINGTIAFNINDSNANSIFSVRSMSTNFGSLANAGAFVGNMSAFTEEFNVDNRTTALTADTAAAAGDDLEFYFDTFTGAATTYSTPASVINGVGRISFPATSGTGAVLGQGSTTAGTLHTTWQTANLPVVQMKIKPSVVGATNDIIWGLTGTYASSGTNDTLPADGIFFHNNNGTNWVGIVRSGGTNRGTATCQGSASTTQFSTGRIEVLVGTGTVNIHFMMDSDASDGTNLVDCGYVSTGTFPAGPFGLVVSNIHTEANARTIDIDYIRAWQDDSQTDPLAGALSVDESGQVPADPDTPPITLDSGGGVRDQIGIIDFTTATSDDLVFDNDVYVRGTLFANKIRANQIEGLEVFTDKLASLQSQLNAAVGLLGASTSSGPQDETEQPDVAAAGGSGDGEDLLPPVVLSVDVQGGLTVQGEATFHGNTMFYKLVTFVEKTAFNNDLTIGRHIVTAGSVPVVVLGPAAGSTESSAESVAASANVAGNDVSGQLTVQLGDGASAGQALSVTFDQPYSKAPHILLTPANNKASTLRYYVESTATGFDLMLTDEQASSGVVIFNYWVVE